MPELPEIAHLAAVVNDCAHHIFYGCIRSAIGGKMGADLPIPRCWRTYSLSAQSRGKELRLTIQPLHIDTDIQRQEERERQQSSLQQAADGDEQEDDASSSQSLSASPSQSARVAASSSTIETFASLSPTQRDLALAVRAQVLAHEHSPSLLRQAAALLLKREQPPPPPLSGPLCVLFRMGMSGRWAHYDLSSAASVSAIHKHSHLAFLSSHPHPLALCFVDARRFGSWQVTNSWGDKRGPDPMTEYADFRRHVLSSTGRPAFGRPLCELLLDQRFFNGIGNYLRAEICHRADVDPFASGREVLERLREAADGQEEATDVLRLCRDVSREAFELGCRYPREADDAQHVAAVRRRFSQWRRCYKKRGMMRSVDGLKRAMWHQHKWSRLGEEEAEADSAQDTEAQRGSARRRKPQSGAKQRRQRQQDDDEDEVDSDQDAVTVEQREAASALQEQRETEQGKEELKSADAVPSPGKRRRRAVQARESQAVTAESQRGKKRPRGKAAAPVVAVEAQAAVAAVAVPTAGSKRATRPGDARGPRRRSARLAVSGEAMKPIVLDD